MGAYALVICLAYALVPFAFKWSGNHLPTELWQQVGYGLLIVAGTLLLLIVIDTFAKRQAKRIVIERKLQHQLALGENYPVKLSVSHPFTSKRAVSVFDHIPNKCSFRKMPIDTTLEPGHTRTIEYDIRPTERGEDHFGLVEYLLTSPLGFWQFKGMSADTHTIRIYPNFAAIENFSLLAMENKTSQWGIRQRPRRGSGLEFHQLREYREGDSMRQVDWKATSRMRKLISREFQDERDQQIVFMLDCSRRMRAQDDELSHFDHALNSVLLLAYVALKQGDSVGIMTFGGDQPRWVPPVKGVGKINQLLNAVYDLYPTTNGADFRLAAEQLSTLCSKRSLVIMATDLRDEDTDDLYAAFTLLARRHLPLLANLRDDILDNLSSEQVKNYDDALSYWASQDYLRLRDLYQRKLKAKGVICLDVTPKQLPTGLINKYWEIKRSARL